MKLRLRALSAGPHTFPKARSLASSFFCLFVRSFVSLNPEGSQQEAVLPSPGRILKRCPAGALHDVNRSLKKCGLVSGGSLLHPCHHHENMSGLPPLRAKDTRSRVKSPQLKPV